MLDGGEGKRDTRSWEVVIRWWSGRWSGRWSLWEGEFEGIRGCCGVHSWNSRSAGCGLAAR